MGGVASPDLVVVALVVDLVYLYDHDHGRDRVKDGLIDLSRTVSGNVVRPREEAETDLLWPDSANLAKKTGGCHAGSKGALRAPRSDWLVSEAHPDRACEHPSPK
jgi:hypothetical protein